MAKYNISFNDKNYSIDETPLSAASTALKSHFSTVMNGTGATVNFGGTAYGIDSAKLSTARNTFVSHLGTIAGNGHKVVVNGTEYNVDSSKLQNAISEIETVLAGTGEERLDGDGAEFYTLAPTALSFRSTAPLNELQEIQINGVTVDPSNYTLEEGSTIVTFPIDYLKTLNVGNYEVAVASDSKTVKGNFTVAAPELNEYGFYYNQVYYNNNLDVGFRAYDNNLVDIFTLTLSNGVSQTTVGYEIRDGFIYADGGYALEIMEDGQLHLGAYYDETFYCAHDEFYVDNDYLYKYEDNGFRAFVLDNTKERYNPARSNIMGMDVNLDLAYNWCTNVTEIEVAYGVKELYLPVNSLNSLRTIILSNSITYINMTDFSNPNIENIVFKGSKAEWDMVEKKIDIYYDGAAYVQCSDGQVSLM